MQNRRSASIAIGALICALALFVAPSLAASDSLHPMFSGQSAVSDDSAPSFESQVFPRNVAWWPYDKGPHYGFARGTSKRDSNVLILPVGSFEIGQGLDLPEDLVANLERVTKGGKQYFLVQLRESAFDLPFRETLESLGVDIVGSLPVSGLMVRADKAAFSRLANSPLIQFVEPFHPAYKIHPSVGRMPQATPELAASPIFTLEIVLFRGEPIDPAVAALSELGAEIVWADQRKTYSHALVRANAALIPAIAKLESVRLIAETSERMQLFNEGAYWHQSAAVGVFPYWDAGIDGDGVTVVITDTGMSADAGDFADTRSDSGWIGPNSGTGTTCADLIGTEDPTTGENTNHRKLACYVPVNRWGGSGDYTACDSTASGFFSHGQVCSGVAVGNATRGTVPVELAPDPLAPSPTDSDDSTYFRDDASAIVYGEGFFTESGIANGFTEADTAFDGVAKGARLIFVDAGVGCPDPDGLLPGNEPSRIQELYTNFGATIHNQSYGSSPPTGVDPTYPTGLDGVIWDNPEVFLAQAAGNDGANSDTAPTCSEIPGNISNQASCKNCAAIAAANTPGGFFTFTSTGPALSSVGGGIVPNDGQSRIAPRFAAEGEDCACRSEDSGEGTAENQTGVATCINRCASGTSFAAPNIAGTAALIEEYLAGGFYPDGTDENPNNASEQVPAFSSALTQAIMITAGQALPGRAALNDNGRFNNSWGWGFVVLNNALPLAGDGSTPSGIILHSLDDLDRNAGTPDEGVSSLPGISARITGNEVQSEEFEVLEATQNLKVALLWYENETGGSALTNDVDLRVCYCGPDGVCSVNCDQDEDSDGTVDEVLYQGNAFREDMDQECTNQDTPADWDLNADGTLDQYLWSISNNAITTNGYDPLDYIDYANNMEAVFVPADGNEPNAQTPDNDADGQGPWPTVKAGKWRIEIQCNACPDSVSPAIAIVGAVAAGSGVTFDKNPATCNDDLILFVSETEDSADPLCPGGVCSFTTTDIANRTKLEVLDAAGNPTGDEISLGNIPFNAVPGTALRFESDRIPLSALVAANAGDGILSVGDRFSVRAVYQDNNGAQDDRVASTRIDCRPDVEVNESGQFGLDQAFSFIGGCDPDRYFDAGETFSLSVAFFNLDNRTINEAEVSLIACNPDQFDTIAGECPSGQEVADLFIGDSPKILEVLPPGTNQFTRFAVSVSGVPTGRKEVDLAFCLSGDKVGQQVKDCSIRRVLLQADNEERYYMTDCPNGCTVDHDVNYDEKYEDPVPPNPFLDPLSAFNEGKDETAVQYESLQTAADENNNAIPDCQEGDNDFTCGNPGFAGIWNFDADDEGFRTGVTPLSLDVDTVNGKPTQWGEDEDWDGTFDIDAAVSTGDEDGPTGTDNVLDQNWGTGGGCGYLTATGCWHTGTIGSGSTAGTQCRGNESICEEADKSDGTAGEEYWIESLRFPAVHPIHFGADPRDGFEWETQITAWEWNAQLDFGEDEGYLWELDLDLADDTITQLGDDLYSTTLLNNVFFGFGLGVISGGQLNILQGGPVFADTCDNFLGGSCNGTAYGDEYNGSIGGNRAGLRGCYFEDLNLITDASENITALPKPLDDDCDNEIDFGPDGCPGACGVDDDGNGVIDDVLESCPCYTCDTGPRAGKGCNDHPACNPSDPGDPQEGDHRCLLDVDSPYVSNPDAPVAPTDTQGATGTPRAYGDDVCGDGNTDEGVFPTFAPSVSVTNRQDRNYNTEVGFTQIENNTLEDFFGPPGDTWQGDIIVVAFEPSGIAADPSYGLAVDDMNLSWIERHPINQATESTCATFAGNPGAEGQCASIGLGASSNTFEGDTRIPVTVIDPDPTGNLGEGDCAGTQVRVQASSEAERSPTFYCLDDTGDGVTFSGEVKTTTKVRNTDDDLVFLAFNFADTPSVSVEYYDQDDGVNAVDVGADGQPGIAGFDDDGDGTTDEADELCPRNNELAAGRTPHVPGTAARWSDDNCGCPDNPVTDVTSATFNAVDLVIKQIIVSDNDGGGTNDDDGFADPGEEVTIDLVLRNASDFRLEDVRLKLATNSPLVAGILDDEVFIPSIEGNDEAPAGGDEVSTRVLGDSFEFEAGNLVTRTSTAETFTSTFSLALQATLKADPALGIDEDLQIDGLFVQRNIEVVHNLDVSGTLSETTFTNDFGYKCTSTQFDCRGGGDTFVECENFGPNGACDDTQYHFFNSGDNAAELDGTRCQYNDPSNLFGFNTDPADYCELGEGLSNTSQHWHIHGNASSACEGSSCPDPNKTHTPDSFNASLHLGYHLPYASCVPCLADPSDTYDGTTFELNRMRWAESANSIQLGLGADNASFANDPEFSYWTQMSITDGGLFGAARGAWAWDAARVYVCVDDDGDNYCDTTEDTGNGPGDGSERWEPISASLNPESNARIAAFINCGYDPSDDGNNEDNLFEGEQILGPSSTCFGTLSDTCYGRTKADYAGPSFPAYGPLVTLSGICFPETGIIDDIVTGVYETGSSGEGIWAKRAYDLGKYKGRRILHRFHVAPTGLAGLDNCANALGTGCGSRDDGWFIDDVEIVGANANALTVAVDNTGTAPTYTPGNECDSVTARVNARPIPNTDRAGNPRPAAVCSANYLAGECDFDEDGVNDAGATGTSPAPGHTFRLAAEPQDGDRCLGGAFEYQFETLGGTVLRPWLTKPFVFVNPAVDTTYVARIRCSTDQLCEGNDSATLEIAGAAPPVCRTLDLVFSAPASNKTTFTWQAPAAAGCPTTYDAASGDLANLRSTGSFATATCLAGENDDTDLTATDATSPAVGQGTYYLSRAGTDEWNSGGGAQSGDRDATMSACP
jgi:hypothetical protein